MEIVGERANPNIQYWSTRQLLRVTIAYLNYSSQSVSPSNKCFLIAYISIEDSAPITKEMPPLLHHENIICYLGFYESPTQFFIIMEFPGIPAEQLRELRSADYSAIRL